MTLDPTDIAGINRAVAELRIKTSATISKTPGVNYITINDYSFSPATDIKQAMQLFDEMVESETPLISLAWHKDSMEFYCQVELEAEDADGCAPTKEAAICLCWLKWKESQG